MHPIVRLVHERLATSPRVALVPAVPAADFHEAVARFGAGLDHAAGEVPLALVKAKLDGSAAARGYSGHYVVTDRRLFGRIQASNVPRTFTEVPYAQLHTVPPKLGGLGQSVEVHAAGRAHRLWVAPKALQAYFDGILATVPPPARTFGPLPLPPRGPQDPSGAQAAGRPLAGFPDVRATAPLRAIFEAHRRGTLGAEAAGALVPPALVLAREIAYGRGATLQGWRSGLPRPALLAAFRQAFGRPAAIMPGPGGEILDFAIGKGGSGTGRAVASTVVGLAALATLGVGWTARSGGPGLATLRVHLADAPGGSAYQLLGSSGAQWEPLSASWWRMVDAVHRALLDIETRYLLGRAVLGPGLAPEHLIALPREVLEPAVARLIGPVDLAACY